MVRLQQRVLAEEAYHEYLGLRERGLAPSTEEFIRAQSAEIREEVRRILGEHEYLLCALQTFCYDLTAGQQLGKFRLLGEIGRGGMGVVWEAEQPDLDRKVAVKVLSGASCVAQSTMNRFKREARAGGRVNHPNIAAVYETGEIEGCLYIAQELIPGGLNLARRISEARQWPEMPADYYREQAALIAQVASALHAAHLSGVVHRDVKPSNILIDTDGRPRLSDFGLALLRDDPGISEAGQFIGTAYYASPEQAAGRNQDVDARADVFSLGVTLYEALTLQRPFDGDGKEEVFRRIREEEPRAPRLVRPRIPRDLEIICRKALEKQPGRRYATAKEMAEDLERFLHHEPIQARPPSRLARAQQWVRRHRTLAGAGAASVVAGSALTALGLDAYQARHVTGRVAQVSEFMVEIADPRDDRSAAEVFGELDDFFGRTIPDQRALQASLLYRLGNTWLGKGRLADAELAATKAVALCASSKDVPEQSCVMASNLLASVMSEQGRRSAAVELWERDCLPYLERHVEVCDAKVLQLMRDHAALLAEKKEYGRAETAMLRSLDRARKACGEDSEEYALAEGNLGVFYCDLGESTGDRARFEEAVQRLSSAVDRLRECKTARYAHILAFGLNLGRAYTQSGNSGLAIATLEPLLPEYERVFGNRHADSILCRVNLSAAYSANRRYADALGKAEEAAQSALAALEPGHHVRILAQQNLGLAYVLHKNFAAAEQALLAVVRELGEEARVDPRVWYALGRCYLSESLDRPDEAERCFRLAEKGGLEMASFIQAAQARVAAKAG